MSLLAHWQVVDKPGTFKVKVAANVKSEDVYVNDDYPRYLIPLRVIRAADLQKITALLHEYGNVPFSKIRPYTISGAIFANDIDLSDEELPVKGEEVLATFDYVDEKLMCTAIKLLPREELEYVNVEAMDALYKFIKEQENERRIQEDKSKI
jgi:hypothetical protein